MLERKVKSPSIVVVGSANMDLVAEVPRCPRPGESVIGTTFRTAPGGKGANQAVAASRLGADAHLVGCVGDDPFGLELRNSLWQAGVKVDLLRTAHDISTGTAVILVEESGQNSIVVVPAANMELASEDIARCEPLIASADAVIVQLEIPLEIVEAVLILAKECRTLSILDAGPAQDVPRELLQLATIVSPNETEAEAITGIAVDSLESAEACGKRIHELGAAHVVLKLGAMGSLYVGDEVVHCPAFNVDVVDTVAAGDAFTAALAIAWNTATPEEALRVANAAGALATTQSGAQNSMPTRNQIDTFLNTKEAFID